MRLWGFAGIAAAACLIAGLPGTPARAADDPAVLPPLSGPPTDVPMREPKPPRDIEGHAPRPPSPPTTTALPTPPLQRQPATTTALPTAPLQRQPAPSAAAALPAPPPRQPSPPAAAALPAPPPPRPTPNRPIIAASAPTPGVISPRPPVGPTVTPRICRGEATYIVTIDGRPQIAVARVCQQDDGTWRLTP